MGAQQAFRQILEELQKTSSHIRLKLPANHQSVHRQLERIALAEQQLDNLHNQVSLLSKKSINSSTRQLCLSLLRAMERMQDTAENLKLLAEEYMTDPEGAILCLHSVNEDSRNLPETLDRLQAIVLR